jgi:2-succinyl-5-enolpyruvyl-6-hydroxy-3-cyclohexene-1-carboxylate synthase
MNVFTEYMHSRPGAIRSPVFKQIVESISLQRAVIVAGELSDRNEAISLNFFIHRYNVACIAEPLSLLPPSDHVLLNPDQLFGVEELVKVLKEKTDIVIRVGGPLISGRLQEWASCIRTVRVIDDGFRTGRHDPQYAAETYIHSRVDTFLIQLESSIATEKSVSRSASPETNYEVVARSHPLAVISGSVRNAYIKLLKDDWHEGQIAKILGLVANEKKSAVFLSASMPCRDFSIFGSLFVTLSEYRLVAANRGANGIDGVISAATGYASATGLTTYVLIGDVATLHDLSGLALALNVHPGSDRQRQPDVRIVCVNNAGGAIFSFLPIRNHNDVFTPYFDTPHALKFSGIANIMRPETAVSVSNNQQLETALRDDSIKFIECVGLPSHEDNVTIHKKIGTAVSQSLVSMFI